MLMNLKFDMQHLVLKYYQICPNDDLGLILTYFTARLNLVPHAYARETVDFLET